MPRSVCAAGSTNVGPNAGAGGVKDAVAVSASAVGAGG